MELIEIIKSTLSIFSTTVLVFLAISYTIYRIKENSRVKPYLKFNVQDALSGKAMEEKGIPIRIEERQLATNQFSEIPFTRIPVQDKFTIINGNVIVNKFNRTGSNKENYIPRLNVAEGRKNMFDLYITQEKVITK
jgi:hypothetical protein